MIEIVEGKGVGAGKSYYIATRLIEHFRRGGTAYLSDSFVLDFDKTQRFIEDRYHVVIERDQYRNVSAEQITSLHEHTAPGTEDNPVLIVLDEVQDQLNARDWADKSKRDLFAWCCQSRHDDNDLIFISQSSLNIDKQIKRLCTFIWSIRNSCNTPVMGVGRLDVLIKTLTLGFLTGRYFICNRLDNNGKHIMGREWLRHDPAIFGCYVSKSMKLSRKRGAAAVARKQLARSKKGNKRMLRFVILFALGGAVALGVMIFKRVSGAKEDHKRPVIEARTQVATQAAAPAYTVETETLRARWRGGMTTNIGEYETGKVSVHGWVEAIRDNVVKIKTPDLRTLYIIGTDQSLSKQASGAPAMPSLPSIFGPAKPSSNPVAVSTPKREIVIAPVADHKPLDAGASWKTDTSKP